MKAIRSLALLIGIFGSISFSGLKAEENFGFVSSESRESDELFQHTRKELEAALQRSCTSEELTCFISDSLILFSAHELEKKLQRPCTAAELWAFMDAQGDTCSLVFVDNLKERYGMN